MRRIGAFVHGEVHTLGLRRRDPPPLNGGNFDAQGVCQAPLPLRRARFSGSANRGIKRWRTTASGTYRQR
jgi:hypothetical protein